MISYLGDELRKNNMSHDIHLLVEHLGNSENVFLRTALGNVLADKDVSIDAVAWLMSNCYKVRIFSERKLVGYHTTPGWTYGSTIRNEKHVSNWNILIEGMLNHDPKILASLIIKYFPQYLRNVTAGLDEIEEKLYPLFKDESYVDIDRIKQCKIELLLQIESKCNYQATEKDKKDLRYYFQCKMTLAKSETELNEIKREYKSSYLLNQRRHPMFDNLYATFFNKKDTSSIEMLDIAMATQLSHYTKLYS